MAGITLAQAQAKLDAAMDALEKAMVAQNYSISSGSSARSLTRAPIDSLQRQVDVWNSEVKRLSRGGMAVRGVTISRG